MKSILLHIEDDEGQEARLQAALDLVRAFNGHLTCLYATPFRDYLLADPFMSAAVATDFLDRLNERRAEMRARFEERLGREDVAWDWRDADGEQADMLAHGAVLSDVVVLSCEAGEKRRKTTVSILTDVVTQARTPVLAVPDSLSRFDPTKPAVIAWNGSPEVAEALRSAVPLLGLASDVHIVMVDGEGRAYPSDAAARYLAHYGIEAEVIERASGSRSVAETLISIANEVGAGYLVFGAYGHSRLREYLIGGVTRELLEHSAVPLFLAH